MLITCLRGDVSQQWGHKLEQYKNRVSDHLKTINKELISSLQCAGWEDEEVDYSIDLSRED